MIISASYRTDIPTFYGEWFMLRLDAGYCMVANPYSSNPYRVSLRREDVDGFVFWTKNLAPFVDRLKQVHERGYPFVVQYAINGYPRELESSVVDANHSIRHMHMLAESYGPRVAVWRYDPIVFTTLTPPDFHRRNFERLAQSLQGTTDEVDIEFANIYKKTRRNMNGAAEKFDFLWHDPADEIKRNLVGDFVQIAKAYGIRLAVCSQRDYVVPGAEIARCVDAQRLSDVAGKPISAKLQGHRTKCGCFQSRDIGAYDTCPHGCVYCYAVQNREAAKRRYQAHDPSDEFLIQPKTTQPS